MLKAKDAAIAKMRDAQAKLKISGNPKVVAAFVTFEYVQEADKAVEKSPACAPPEIETAVPLFVNDEFWFVHGACGKKQIIYMIIYMM
jgi:hypothetical protein